jgi:PleD family two-component response regulator
MGKSRILIVEDDPDIGNLLITYFDQAGFETSLAARGHDALRMTQHVMPQLIVLDINLPDIDGYEVCRLLRGSSRTAHIPILFLTQRDEHRDRIAGLELGADDYITKPFDTEELRLRVQNAIARSERDNLTDPRTGLPTSQQIEAQLQAKLSRKGWSLLNCRLVDFDSYRNTYGDPAGDDFLRSTAEWMLQVVDEAGQPDDFIGYAGGDNFVILTEESRAAAIESKLKVRLGEAIPGKYSYVDQQRGYCITQTESGKEIRTPLAHLAISSIHSSSHNFTEVRQIMELASAAMKNSGRG